MRYNEGKNSELCGYLKKERKMLNFLGRVQFIGQRMMYADVQLIKSPAPQGAGGLKCRVKRQRDEMAESRPARGGWIEILDFCLKKV